MEDTLAPPSSLGADLPNHQEAALMKGLAVRQENRYQTISELFAALRIETPTSAALYFPPQTVGNDAYDVPLPHVPPHNAEQPPLPAGGDPVSEAPLNNSNALLARYCSDCLSATDMHS